MTCSGSGRFAGFVAPHLPPHERVHGFGEGFGQAVSQQFGHDGRIVVARGAEFFAQLLQPDAGRHGETADPVAVRGDEVRQRQVLLRRASGCGASGGVFRALSASVTRMSSPLGACREDARACSVSSRSSRMRASRAWASAKTLRASAPFGMVENLGVTPLEPPRREEEVPVDVRFGVGHVESRGRPCVPCGAVRRVRAAPRRAALRASAIGMRSRSRSRRAYSSRRACWSAFTLSA